MQEVFTIIFYFLLLQSKKEKAIELIKLYREDVKNQY